MISKFIKLKGAIQQFLVFLKSVSGKKKFNRKMLPDLSEEDWALLSGLCIILKPFTDVTEVLNGGKYPTFSQALPLLRTLKNFVSDHDLFNEDVITQKSSHVDLRTYIGEDFPIYCSNFKELLNYDLKRFCRAIFGNRFDDIMDYISRPSLSQI